MTIKVYKGFDEKFLDNVQESALIDSSSSEKIDYNKIDERNVAMNIISKSSNNGEYWMTYEEYQVAISALNYINDKKIVIIKNNIYPDIYPLYSSISDDLYDDFIKSTDETTHVEDVSDELKKFKHFYNSIEKIDDSYYVTYYNEEYNNYKIDEVIEYYDTNIDVEVANGNEDLNLEVTISDDILNYVESLDLIRENDYKTIGIKEIVKNDASFRVKNSLLAFAKLNNLKLFYSSSLEEKPSEIRSEINSIANELLNPTQFKPHDLFFYKNPYYSDELEHLNQSDIIEMIISEAEKAYSNEKYRDIFMTAPTGAGKSLIYQIPALYLTRKYKKLILVIEPLKGLMSDQRSKFKEKGYTNVEYLNSDIATPAEKQAIINKVISGEIDILYVSPETLISRSIYSLIGEREIGLIIIDEAHIVTTWGVGFRPDYWYLGKYINDLRKKTNYKGQENKNFNFPIFACTATAVIGGKDDTVSETVCSLYMKNNPIIKVGPARRDDISFQINYMGKKTRDEYNKQKVEILGECINNWIDNKEKTIIYTPYRVMAQDMYEGKGIYKDFDVFTPDVGVYTGGKQFYDIDKDTFMANFKESKINVMYATKAFGMGIDIKDIKNVYHYAITGGLSDYVQEIGRAARDENIHGIAMIDYFDNDSDYTNQLYGMSQIQQYHIKGCLRIIYETFRKQFPRAGFGRFLISPSVFSSVFGAKNDNIENKLKIVLLMLEKDFMDTFGTPVMTSRPSSLFTTGFVSFYPEKEYEILHGKYGKYFKEVSEQIDLGHNRSWATATSSPGKIYEINLEQIWKDSYQSLSFQQFKYFYFQNTNHVPNPFQSDENTIIIPEIRSYLYDQIKVTVSSNGVKLNQLFDKASNDLDFICAKLSEFDQHRFTEQDFAEKLKEKYSTSMSETISNAFLDIIASSGRVLASYREKVYVKNGLMETESKKILSSSPLMVSFRNIEETEYSTYINASNTKDINALKLLSLLDLITYEIEGGKDAKVFIVINAPDKIRNIVEDRIPYRNSYVETAREKHYRDVKLINYFIKELKTDTQRWDFIQDYFRGVDVENIIDGLKTNNNSKMISLESFIQNNIENPYLLSDYNDWDEIINAQLVRESLKYYCKYLKEKSIRIPKYGMMTFNFENKKVNALFVYSDKNVIITENPVNMNVRNICEEKGWKIFSIYDIEKNVHLLK